jgi:TolB-like protein/DNA-binding winged helix-turn-helix (wHTH) protein/tetratricopeptide (TPR) repeat protein
MERGWRSREDRLKIGRVGTSLRFGDFELDLTAYQLRRAGHPVHLERRPMEALILLATRKGGLVSREELIERLWGPKVVIDFDTGLNTVVRKIRQALEDPADQPLFLETITGKGYRFIAAVEEVSEAAKPAAAQSSGRRAWVAATAVAVIVAVLIAAGLLLLRQAPAVRIAVLPFDNLSATREQDYLVDGLAEDTIASLGQIDPAHLEVIGPASTLAYKRGGKPLAEIGRELDVDYAVQGSLRVEGTRLRVTSTLIRVDDHVQLWTAAFDRELTSTLGLQRDLSAAIAQQVRIRISPERSAALVERQTADPAAYDLYLRGRHEWRRVTPAGNRAALQYYEQAIERDPNYALAWSGIAQTLGAAPMNSDVRPAAVVERARDAARRAVERAPDLGEAQLAWGYQHFWLDWHWDLAVTALRRAVELDPNNGFAHLELGHVLSQLGQQEEARLLVRRARELDPLFTMTYALSAQVAFQGRDFAEAQELARQTIAIDPQFWIGYMQLAQPLEQIGDLPGALAALDQAVKYAGGNFKPRAMRAYVLARMGRTEEAAAVLAELEASAGQQYVPPYMLALINAGLGREEEARQWLERGLAERDIHLGFLPVDPKWDAWRKQPWFVSLLERCQFAT